MKNLYAAGVLWCLLFSAFTSFAQGEPPLNQHIPEQPFLFPNLPNKFECNLEVLEKLFSHSTDQKLNIKLSDAFQLEGVMSGKFIRSKHLTSINIVLQNYKGALFNISRIAEEKGITYVGRILNINNGDVLQLIKEKDKYFFVKQERRFVMVE